MITINTLIAWKTSRHFRFEGKRIEVPADKTNCKDREARDNGYWIGRAPEDWSILHVIFIARHDWNDENKEPIAWLFASTGACNNLHTKETSQKCGIGEELMKFCLNDEWITAGSTDKWTSANEQEFTVWGDEKFRSEAGQFCASINHIQCQPTPPTPTIICKAYIRATKDTGYDMMFIDGKHRPTYEVLKTKAAESLFISDPKTFVTSRGRYWFFCKCKPDEVANCHDLEKYAKTIGTQALKIIVF